MFFVTSWSVKIANIAEKNAEPANEGWLIRLQ